VCCWEQKQLAAGDALAAGWREKSEEFRRKELEIYR
jgi:hypothetical protein